MRKFLISLLMASAAIPASASAGDGDFLRGIRAASERSHQREDAAETRSQSQEQPTTTRRHEERRSSGGHREHHREVRRDHRELHETDPTRREHRQFHREVDRDHRSEHRSWDRDSRRGGHGEYHRDLREEHGDLHASDPSRREHRQWHRDTTRQHVRRHDAWDTNWRRDNRYDWRNYRYRHGSLYRLGHYYDPYGWGYRRFSIGFSLWPNYYRSSRYWLNDPWQYRLPYAPAGYRWIRYYDDALLVDSWNGRVVDVIHNFFW